MTVLVTNDYVTKIEENYCHGIIRCYIIACNSSKTRILNVVSFKWDDNDKFVPKDAVYINLRNSRLK